MLNERAPGGRAAPRFHLARTRLGNLWRLRSDLEPAVAIRLATLAGKEPALGDPVVPPEREEFLRRALEQSAPIEAHWTGPAFGLPAVLAEVPDSGALVREIAVDAAARVHPELGWDDAELARAGCIGAEVDGEIVSVCACVRGDGKGPTEAGVVTAPEHRGRGYGLAVVRACELTRRRAAVQHLVGQRGIARAGVAARAHPARRRPALALTQPGAGAPSASSRAARMASVQIA
jgi:GNAT superfamily N-acetyltransferase